MQQNFQEAHDPRVMDFDSGITDGADGHRQSQTLQQRKIHMDVEPLGLAIGETIGNDLESFAHSIQVSEPLLQTEVAQIVGTQFVAQEPGKLFILLEEGVFPIGSEDMMTVLNLLDNSRQFAAQSLVEPDAEDLTDAVGRQMPEPPSSQRRSKILWMGKGRLKMKLRHSRHFSQLSAAESSVGTKGGGEFGLCRASG